jgi:hypothetical protein
MNGGTLEIYSSTQADWLRLLSQSAHSMVLSNVQAIPVAHGVGNA